MNQLKALLRGTWWLWIVFYVGCAALYVWVDSAFIVAFPILLFTMVYFAFIRFDEDGERR